MQEERVEKIGSRRGEKTMVGRKRKKRSSKWVKKRYSFLKSNRKTELFEEYHEEIA